MGRRHRRDTEPRPRRRPTTGGPPVGLEARESWLGEDFVVRPLRGDQAGKDYRCPGCGQEIRAGTAHLVVWATADRDAADRRHWHRSCWTARDRRGPRDRRHR